MMDGVDMDMYCELCVCFLSALKILAETAEDRLWVLQQNGGLAAFYEALITLCRMHHEATACHVAADMVDLLMLITGILKVARNISNGASGDKKGQQHIDLKILSFDTNT